LGKNILKLENKGNGDKIGEMRFKRNRINRQISEMNHLHPIRVYSALLEYSDATSLRMYHKMHNIITNKLEKEKEKLKNTNKNKKESKDKLPTDDLMTYLQTDEDNAKDENLNDFGDVGKFSFQKLEKIIE